VAREFIETGNNEIVFEKPVAGSSCFQLVVREDLERQVEPTPELVLPLFCETSRTYDKASLKVATRDQFLDQQSSHNRFAGARVVCQQKSQRLARQHGLVNGRDLVR